jgi:hypothetical protein
VLFEQDVFPYQNIIPSAVNKPDLAYVELPWLEQNPGGMHTAAIPVQSPAVPKVPTHSPATAIPTIPSNVSPSQSRHHDSPSLPNPLSTPCLPCSRASRSLSTPASTTSTPIALCLPRSWKVPDRLGNWAKGAEKVDTSDDAAEAPKTWKQLLRSPDKSRWLKAADNEFASLTGMETWNLVPQPVKC